MTLSRTFFILFTLVISIISDIKSAALAEACLTARRYLTRTTAIRTYINSCQLLIKRHNSRMGGAHKMLSSNTRTSTPHVLVQDLDLEFMDKPIFHDLNFSLHPSDKVTVVGENGIGKSTFLKVLTGELSEYDGRVDVSGSFGYLPQTFEHFEDGLVMEHIIHHSRDPNLVSLLTTDQFPVFSPEWYDLFNSYGGFNLFRSLNQIGLTTQILTRRFLELSGGEKTKIHLCSLALCSPDFLFLDEPTNHLDATGLKWLSSFVRQFNGGVVMVTHDRALIKETANRISELSPLTRNFVHFRGGYKHYLDEQEKIYERLRMERLRQERELKSVKKTLSDFQNTVQTSVVRRSSKDKDKIGFNARGERKQKGQRQRINQIKQKVELLEDSLVNVPLERKKVEFDLSAFLERSDLSLEAHNLSKSIAGRPLFSSLSFNARTGERIIITGKNGAGKTTLLRIISGLTMPNTGSVQISGTSRIGFLDQEQDTLDLTASPFSLLTKHSQQSSPDKVMKLLEMFGLYYKHDIYTPLATASIGCRRKVQLAHTILRGSNILLLDEPTNHIDLLSLERIEDQLLTFPGIVIAVSHDRYFMDKVATQIINLDDYYQEIENVDR